MDDLAIVSAKTAEGRALRKWFEEQIKTQYEFSSSPDDNVYLGMTLERTKEGHLVLTQRAYIARMMATLGFEDCAPVWTPSPGGKVSVEDCAKCDPKDNPNGRGFREKCGMMRWIEQCTRPDISATLSELCKVQINPGDVHMKMMNHLCKYVNTTRDFLGNRVWRARPGAGERTADDVCGFRLGRRRRHVLQPKRLSRICVARVGVLVVLQDEGNCNIISTSRIHVDGDGGKRGNMAALCDE